MLGTQKKNKKKEKKYPYCSLLSPYKFHYNLFERPLDFCNLFDLSSGELMYMQAYGKILS